MNADTLRKLGVPESNVSTALKVWQNELVLETAHSAALVIRTMTEQLPPERQAIADAALGRLTLQRAAQRAECCVKTLRRAIAAGELKASRTSTGRVCLDRPSFREWLRKHVPRKKVGAKVDMVLDNVDTVPERPLTVAAASRK